MSHFHNDNLFQDISTINYRDTNISFSVENILNNQYYSSSSLKLQQKLNKKNQTEKNQKSISNKNKKEIPGTPKVKKDNERASKNKAKEFNKCVDKIEEKDTEDNSETLKIMNSKSNTKQQSPKKKFLSPNIHSKLTSNLLSNKIPPVGHNRSRTKSYASLKTPRKLSKIGREQLIAQIASSNISLNRNKSKLRSQTIKQFNENLKMKNENIVRNDYFEEAVKQEIKNSKIQGGFNKNQRNQSGVKKGISDKNRKKNVGNLISATPQKEKLNIKSPRFQKK